MPVVRRSEPDMFRLEYIADIMVNPTTMSGKMEVGLGREFSTRFPGMLNEFQKKLNAKELRVGALHIYPHTGVRYKVISMVTKNHFADAYDRGDIVRCLEALRRYLQEPGHRFYQVVIPVLADARDPDAYERAYKLFEEQLGDLDATIHLCMSPQVVGRQFKYLAIVGPRIYGSWTYKDPEGNVITKTPEHRDRERQEIEDAVKATLTEWGEDYCDYDGIVSGGADGVDEVACGRSAMDPTYLTSLAHRFMPQNPPIVVKADWERFNLGAGMIRNHVVNDIATSMIIFRPHGMKSIGTTGMLKWVERMNAQHGSESLFYTKLKIIGNADSDSPEGKKLVGVRFGC